MKKIGFIGLGTMGLAMANNILKAGYELTVYNRTPQKAERLQGTVNIAASPADVARHSEIIFTMLYSDDSVQEIILGKEGVIEGLSENKIVIDCTTVSPDTSKKVSQELAKQGVEFLDAPVTGSEPHAIEGVLTFMVGGKREIYEQCNPLFEAMGKSSYYMGEVGSGSHTKLANNTMVGIHLLALSEAITMVAKAGIDPRLFIEVVSAGGARSGMVDNKADKILNRDFRPQFTSALMYKDLGLAVKLASELKIPVPVLSVVKEMYQMNIVKGHQNEDMSSIVKTYEEWAGVEVRNPE